MRWCRGAVKPFRGPRENNTDRAVLECGFWLQDCPARPPAPDFRAPPVCWAGGSGGARGFAVGRAGSDRSARCFGICLAWGPTCHGTASQGSRLFHAPPGETRVITCDRKSPHAGPRRVQTRQGPRVAGAAHAAGAPATVTGMAGYPPARGGAVLVMLNCCYVTMSNCFSH